MNTRPSLPSIAGLACGGIVIGLSSTAGAGGVGIPGYGSQAQPRAGAFAAKADDPSAIFHNPAGIAKAVGTVVQIGVNLINFSQSFQRAGAYEPCVSAQCPDEPLPYEGQPFAKVKNQTAGQVAIGDFGVVPLISATSDLGLDLPVVFAAGIFAPAAGAPDREFSPDYIIENNPDEPPPPQRYDIIRQEVVVLQPSVAVGYRVSDKFDVGARASWGFANVRGETSVWGLRNYEEWEGFDVSYILDAKDNFIPSFGLGALYRPLDSLELGFNYRSAQSIKAKGTAVAIAGSGTLIQGVEVLQPRTEAPFVCGPGGTAAAFTACVQMDLPQIATLGGRWIWRDSKGEERADIELDVQWENWSASGDIINRVDAKTVTLPALPEAIIKHNFKDVFSFRLGGSYTLPVGANKLSFRGGLAHDTETAEVGWTRLDQDVFARTTLATGLAYDIDGWRFELSGGAVLEGTRTVDHGGCNPTPDNLGCDGTGQETPVDEREGPDPAQPIYRPNNQAQSPFNAGVYEQGYVFLGTGVTAWF